MRVLGFGVTPEEKKIGTRRTCNRSNSMKITRKQVQILNNALMYIVFAYFHWWLNFILIFTDKRVLMHFSHA